MKHLDKKNRRRNFLHCTLCISLLLLFRSHLGLTLVVTLCNSIIPLMELCLCFNCLSLFDGCCSLRLWWGLERWLLLVFPQSRACCPQPSDNSLILPSFCATHTTKKMLCSDVTIFNVCLISTGTQYSSGCVGKCFGNGFQRHVFLYSKNCACQKSPHGIVSLNFVGAPAPRDPPFNVTALSL